MSNDNQQEKAQETPQESFEAFCNRVGIKLHRGEKGGVEFSPFYGGNLLHKKPKQEKKPQETLEEFSKRVGLKYVRAKGSGLELGAYPGGSLLHKKPKKTSSQNSTAGRAHRSSKSHKTAAQPKGNS